MLTRIGRIAELSSVVVSPPTCMAWSVGTVFSFFSLTLVILAAPRQLHVDMEQMSVVHAIFALSMNRLHACS